MKVHEALPKVIADHFTVITKPITRLLCTGFKLPEYNTINQSLAWRAEELELPATVTDFDAGSNADKPLYHEALPDIIRSIRNKADAKMVLALMKAAPPPENHHVIVTTWREEMLRRGLDTFADEAERCLNLDVAKAA